MLDEEAKIILWVLVIVAVLIGIIGVYCLKIKCPYCKKRKCSEISRQQTGTKQISIQKEEKIKHYSEDQIVNGIVKLEERYRPSSVSVRKYTVPGRRIYYDVKYRCNNCGKTFVRNEYKEVEGQ